MRLFQVTNPITTRVGAEVFASLPNGPGVYFFYDITGKLLYIGQSLNLRARVTSYRHVSPERHPRRILRLVHRIARIEWQTCETPEAAIQLERVLLLQHRPPFNRAGTWQQPPWYLRITIVEDHLHLSLARAVTPVSDVPSVESASAASNPPSRAQIRAAHRPLPFLDTTPSSGVARPSIGEASLQPSSAAYPLPRAIHAVLCRCLIRLHHPQLPLSQYPAGLLNFTAPVELSLPFPGKAADVAQLLTEFLQGRPLTLLDALQPLLNEETATAPEDPDGVPQTIPEEDSIAAYWSAQVEMLHLFAVRKLSASVAASDGSPTNDSQPHDRRDQNAM